MRAYWQTGTGGVILRGVNGLTPKSILVDRLRPELGAQIVKALADDNERAQRDKRAKAARKRKAAGQPAGEPAASEASEG